MLEWILANPDTAATVAGLAVAVLLAAVEVIRRTGSVRQALLAAMLRIERARRRGELPIDGPAAMDWVIAWAMTSLVPRAPVWLRPALTEERLRRWAQGLYDLALDLLDDGALNGTRPAIPGDEDQPAV